MKSNCKFGMAMAWGLSEEQKWKNSPAILGRKWTKCDFLVL